MLFTPKQFYCELQSVEEVIFHVPEQPGFIKKSLLFTGMWAVDIQWGGVDNSPQIKAVLSPKLLATTQKPEYVKLSIVTKDMPNMPLAVELVISRTPCWVKQGCLLLYQFESDEEPIYEMRRELLNKATAWEFCRHYDDSRINRDDDLSNLAVEIWQQQGHPVKGIFRQETA